MATRQRIVRGFPSPSYVAETGTRGAIRPGDYVIEGSSNAALPPPPSVQKPWHHVARQQEAEDEFFPVRRWAAPAPPELPAEAIAFSRLAQPIDDDDPGWRPPRRAVVAVALPRGHALAFHHHLTPDDDEPAFAAPRRAFVAVALPSNRRAFWRFHPPLEDDDAQILAQILSARRAELSRAVVQRPQVALIAA